MTIWGASYKAGTDDLRCSVAFEIIKSLARQKVIIQLFDPAAMVHLEKMKLPRPINLLKNQSDSLTGSELLVILNEWPQFSDMPLSQIKKRLKKPNIFDSKNLFNPTEMTKMGFNYFCLGHP
ncbi:MAG: hypothetical protein H7235_09755 [Bdellovibrionaceae bacterium]|nr:hypothetical protein [Pseudobdellovibrionaceae bacterium]